MGALASRNFEEMMEEDIVPPTPPVGKRVLDQDLDPRSPTCGIARTPIQVLKTPEFICDPRSPTTGIDRTPICSKFTSDTETEKACIEQSTEVENQAMLPLKMSELLDEMEHIENETEPTSLSQDICQTPVKAETNGKSLPKAKPNSEKRSRKPKTMVIGHTNIDTEVELGPDSSKQTVRSPLKVLGDRSPLTSRNVDYNSPRAIVQRKQASKLTMKKPGLQLGGTRNSPVKYRTMQEDKENM